MIDPRRAQRSFGDKLIAEEVKDLHEDWMIHADEVLADEEILVVVYEALAQRRRLSRTRGRKATSAEATSACAEAHPQLELRHARAGGAHQLAVPQLHPAGICQDARC